MPKANYTDLYNVNILICTKTKSVHVVYFYTLLRITRKVIFPKHAQVQRTVKWRHEQKADKEV